jgi:hypothetical protein
MSRWRVCSLMASWGVLFLIVQRQCPLAVHTTLCVIHLRYTLPASRYLFMSIREGPFLTTIHISSQTLYNSLCCLTGGMLAVHNFRPHMASMHCPCSSTYGMCPYTLCDASQMMSICYICYIIGHKHQRSCRSVDRNTGQAKGTLTWILRPWPVLGDLHIEFSRTEARVQMKPP